MESDFYGLQKPIWRIIKYQRKETHELVSANRILKETLVDDLKELYKKQHIENKPNILEIVINNDIIIEKRKWNYP